MTQLRASVIAGLSQLVSATTVSAECAWVMWGEPSGWRAWLGSRWMPVRTYQSLRDCEDTQTAFYYLQQTRVVDQRTRENAKALGYNAMMSYRCLPDTVDPRGPK